MFNENQNRNKCLILFREQLMKGTILGCSCILIKKIRYITFIVTRIQLESLGS